MVTVAWKSVDFDLINDTSLRNRLRRVTENETGTNGDGRKHSESVGYLVDLLVEYGTKGVRAA